MFFYFSFICNTTLGLVGCEMSEWSNVPSNVEDYVGFIYLITNITNGKKYIGKKFYWRKLKRPPLKGKKRKRISTVESDWRTYYGSCNTLHEDIERIGKEKFDRVILQSFETKWECAYYEMKEQVERNVLFRDDYYNGIISVKIHKAKPSLRLVN